MVISNRILSMLAGALGLALTGPALAATGDGQPAPWQMGFQKANTPIMEQITSFHAYVTIIITVIALFVFGLMVYVMVRFNEKRNPEPTRTTHNTSLEIALDGGADFDPRRHRHPLVPAPLRPVRFPQGRPHHHGDGQSVVLEL